MDSGNDYVIQVKDNQKLLCIGVKETVQNEELIDEFITEEINKGRREKRSVRLYNYNERYISKEWANVKRVIEVINEGVRGKRKYYERHFYLSSLKENRAEVYAKGIRQHWYIENKLHWVKDVILNEDNCLIQEKVIVANLSLIKSVIISLFRIQGYSSIKKAIERFKNRAQDTSDLMGINCILNT